MRDDLDQDRTDGADPVRPGGHRRPRRRSFRLAAAPVVLMMLAGCGTTDQPTPQTLSPSSTITMTSSAPPTTVAPAPSTAGTATSTPATSTSVPTTPASLALIPNSVESAPATDGLDPQEAVNRQNAEAAWYRFWDVYIGIPEVAVDQRAALLGQVALDPVATRILEGSTDATKDGIANYGGVGHRVSWPENIAGDSEVTILDCLDQSSTGSFRRGSGEVLTRGGERTDIRGDLVKGQDGTWRVTELYTEELTC